jgi:hypothetical protein
MHHIAMFSEELLAFLFCYYMQTSTGLCVRCVESMLIPVAKLQTDTTLLCGFILSQILSL